LKLYWRLRLALRTKQYVQRSDTHSFVNGTKRRGAAQCKIGRKRSEADIEWQEGLTAPVENDPSRSSISFAAMVRDRISWGN